MWIYLLRCLPTGKIYVGKTVARVAMHRAIAHVKEAMEGTSDRPLMQAIRQYGADQFTVEVLEKVEDKGLLLEREIHWIETLDSTNPEVGLNVYARWTDYANKAFHKRKARLKRVNRFIGVFFVNGAYRMSVCHYGRAVTKAFHDEREAAIAYDKCSCHLNGRRTDNLNFPELLPTYTDADMAACWRACSTRAKASGYRGITRSKGRWVVQTRFRFQPIRTTVSFATEEEAAEAFDRISLHLRGAVKARLNFPDNAARYQAEDLAAFYLRVTAKRPTSSPHKGLSYHKRERRWYARHRGTTVGRYPSEAEALTALQAHLDSTLTQPIYA